MGLEFLLRRTPSWREVAEGILLGEGDIVEQGQEAEERAVEGATARGAPVTGSASLVSPCRTRRVGTVTRRSSRTSSLTSARIDSTRSRNPTSSAT